MHADASRASRPRRQVSQQGRSGRSLLRSHEVWELRGFQSSRSIPWWAQPRSLEGSAACHGPTSAMRQASICLDSVCFPRTISLVVIMLELTGGALVMFSLELAALRSGRLRLRGAFHDFCVAGQSCWRLFERRHLLAIRSTHPPAVAPQCLATSADVNYVNPNPSRDKTLCNSL